MKIKNKMKGLLLIAAIGLACVNAQAGFDVSSLQVTNVVNPNDNIVGNPTNTAGANTNGLYTGTGRYLSTKDYDNFSITVTALTTATNTGNLVIVLTRANVPGTPVSSDFESLPLPTLSAPIVVGTNNVLVWTTNAPSKDWVLASTQVGIKSITNTCQLAITGAGGNPVGATNIVIRVTRKLVGVNNY